MTDPMIETAQVPPALAPALGVRGAHEAMAWYSRVLGAQEVLRLTGPGDVVQHAELRIRGCLIMLGEESPDDGNHAPQSLGGTPVRLHLYVDDVDAVVRRAEDEGAEVLIPVSDQFYGDRTGRFRDPYGHVWIVATRVEEVPPEEMQRRMETLLGG